MLVLLLLDLTVHYVTGGTCKSDAYFFSRNLLLKEMSIVITSKRKRKSNGNESITPDVADSGKKKRMETSKGDTSGKGEMNDVEIDISEEEHSKLLGLVTGQMKRLPLGEGVGEMEEDQVGLLKNKKKKRRLEKKREGSRDGVQKEAGGSVDKESASEYLNLWDTDRCNWSFKKKTQYWLLQNMYDKQQVCDPQEDGSM